MGGVQTPLSLPGRPQKANRPGWDHLPFGWLLSTHFVDLVGMVDHVLSEPCGSGDRQTGCGFPWVGLFALQFKRGESLALTLQS